MRYLGTNWMLFFSSQSIFWLSSSQYTSALPICPALVLRMIVIDFTSIKPSFTDQSSPSTPRVAPYQPAVNYQSTPVALLKPAASMHPYPEVPVVPVEAAAEA